MVAEPVAIPVASPVDEIVAMLVAPEVQDTADVRSCVDESEYVPVAIN